MVIATGFFDGVHLGHRFVIDRLVRAARDRGDESMVVTFWPHPRNVLQDDARNLRLLTSLQEKTGILKGLGVDHVEVLPFTRAFSRLTTEEYFKEYVIGRFGGKAVLIGYDNRVGSDLLSPDQIDAPEQCRPLGRFRPSAGERPFLLYEHEVLLRRGGPQIFQSLQHPLRGFYQLYERPERFHHQD